MQRWLCLWLIFCWLPWSGFAHAASQAEKDAWEALNTKAVRAYRDGKYHEGLQWAQKAYEYAQQHFGDKHPDTLTSLHNLAGLYDAQGRYGEAEPLYKQALQLSTEVLGDKHPNTFTSLNNLAFLYYAQGRYGEAEPLYKQALSTLSDTLGTSHPNTLIVQKNYIVVLILLHKERQALAQLKTMETHLASRAALQLSTLLKDRVRRQWLRSESTFQDLVFTFAQHSTLVDAHAFAAGHLGALETDPGGGRSVCGQSGASVT